MVKKDDVLDWELPCNDYARIIIQTEMSRRDMKFPDLTQLLNEKCNLNENVRNIRNRVARGTFSAGFFIMCLFAMDVTDIKLEKTF